MDKLTFSQYLELLTDIDNLENELKALGWEFTFSKGRTCETMRLNGLTFGEMTLALLMDDINNLKNKS